MDLSSERWHFIGIGGAGMSALAPAFLDHGAVVSGSELVEARRLGLPVVKRAALLGMLMDMRRGVAVAGTHGKTTTSAMIAWVLARAGRDPSYMVGGSIRGLGPGGHWGRG